MSLHTLAQDLAAKGRHGDSMLVHMTPSEVGGLQALAMAHGGSLSVNPDTGLVEANFLKKLLPTILGIGLSFMGVPTWAIGLGTGAVETLRTGDLGRGIMAGLGAYGGANIGQALTSMGSQAAAASALPAGGATATGVPAFSGADSLIAQSISAPQMSAVPGVGGSSLLEAAGSNVLSPSAVSALETTAAENFAKQGMFDQLGQGVQAAIAEPKTFASTLYNQMGPSGSIAAATPTFMAVSEALTPKYDFPTTTEEKSTYEGPYIPTTRLVRYPGERTQDEGEFSFFTPSNPVPGYGPYRFAAQGGLMGLSEGGSFDDEVGNDMAVGGLTALAGGRYLQGPGDGTSDSIPATIANKQPARLADGEFVIDARTVSEIGNGSSNAGAKKLYAMMDRVHSARKKAKRGQDTKAERFMPA